jgi:hypothetical protein
MFLKCLIIYAGMFTKGQRELFHALHYAYLNRLPLHYLNRLPLDYNETEHTFNS